MRQVQPLNCPAPNSLGFLRLANGEPLPPREPDGNLAAEEVRLIELDLPFMGLVVAEATWKLAVHHSK